MNSQDKKRFFQALGTMFEMWEKKASPLVAKAYFGALEKYDVEQVEDAISQAIATCTFFPKPANIIELITGGKQGLEDRATVEASKVLEAIKRYGAGCSMVFDDSTTMAVIQHSFGGWVKMCELRSDQEIWFRKDFAKAYQTYKREGIEHFGHLPGIHEIGNNAHGFHEFNTDPVFIGDYMKCRQIAEKTAPDLLVKNDSPALKLIQGIGG